MQLDKKIKSILKIEISKKRKEILSPLIHYIQNKRDKNQAVVLNFICTHNSRRSQFAQIWAKTASVYYKKPITSFSGGIEITSFNKRAIASLEQFGFEIKKKGNINPHYFVKIYSNNNILEMFSKLFNDKMNLAPQYAAVITCNYADENCPAILDAEKRITIQYIDPKISDNTPKEANQYDQISLQISSEMFYVFSEIR